jgi:ABC-2 type transport system permease protein
VIALIARLTVRQLLGRGRTLLMGLLALLPILVAVVYRLGSQDTDPQEWAATVLLEGLVVTTVLPLAAVVYGTAVLGSEIEDGTAVYLLAKPISRARIIAAKLLSSWLVTSVTVLVPALVAGAIALAGEGGWSILVGFGVALVLGSLVYSSLFVMLSVITSRALIAGLIYVFIWEGLVNGIFTGTRLLSIRHYTLGVADLLVDAPVDVFEAKLGAVTALVLMTIVGLATAWYATRRLKSFEIGETT